MIDAPFVERERFDARKLWQWTAASCKLSDPCPTTAPFDLIKII